MQLKLRYKGEELKCKQMTGHQNGNHCQTAMCSRELMLKVLRSLIREDLMPVIYRIFEIQELFQLADITCLGENQLHHTIRMCDYIMGIKDSILAELGVQREKLITAVLFHDSGKGQEVDDSVFYKTNSKSLSVPRKLSKFGIRGRVNFFTPVHDHIAKSVQIAMTYNLDSDVLEAIALHHHVKILPETLGLIARGLYLPGVICEDILQYKPDQYSIRGSILAQVLAALDQLCAIERNFGGKFRLTAQPEALEAELVKDLVIGVTDASDPRISFLQNFIVGNETVILFDLRDFGSFVQQNTEYKVQATKKDVLNTIRSVIRVQDHHREKDLAGLVGGDEFVVITKVMDKDILEKMISRIDAAILARTGLRVRYGHGSGLSIVENFHSARNNANIHKQTKTLSASK